MTKLAAALYTARAHMENSVEDTLEQVAKLGYSGVEFAGFFGKTAQEIDAILKKNSLEALSSHVSFDQIRDNPQEVISYHKAIGCKNIVVPWHRLCDEESVQELCTVLDSVYDLFSQEGLRLLYHNHNHEFVMLADRLALLEMYDRMGGRIKLEVDLFWVNYAGVDVVSFIKENAGKIALVHLKDGNGDVQTSVGYGSVGYDRILPELNKLSLDYYITESDQPDPDGISDLAKSAEYLKTRIQYCK